MYAGITISGINGEVMPGQWEYQVGPCVGIDSGDQLTMSRYLMLRVTEQVGLPLSLLQPCHTPCSATVARLPSCLHAQTLDSRNCVPDDPLPPRRVAVWGGALLTLTPTLTLTRRVAVWGGGLL